MTLDPHPGFQHAAVLVDQLAAAPKIVLAALWGVPDRVMMSMCSIAAVHAVDNVTPLLGGCAACL